MKKLVPIIAFLLAHAAQAQTVFSDDFEDNIPGLNRVPTGWTITNGGTVDILGQGDFSFLCLGSGTCVDLDGSSNFAGVLSRDVTLAAHTTYILSFDIAGNRRNVGTETGVVTFGSTSLSYSLSDSSPSAIYQTMSLTFTPETTGRYSLRFANDGNDSYGAILDNVTITAAVPEPGSLAMLLVGLGCIGLAKRRGG